MSGPAQPDACKAIYAFVGVRRLEWDTVGSTNDPALSVNHEQRY